MKGALSDIFGPQSYLTVNDRLDCKLKREETPPLPTFPSVFSGKRELILTLLKPTNPTHE